MVPRRCGLSVLTPVDAIHAAMYLLRQYLESDEWSISIKDDPLFDALRGEPGFEAIAAEIERRIGVE